ncbi:Uncharacterised protein [Streptococcus pneumoniae]|nr:Uncharacterised protein [Streptococcus pneumoniae]
MISNYVVECVFCEENRKARQAIVINWSAFLSDHIFT